MGIWLYNSVYRRKGRASVVQLRRCVDFWNGTRSDDRVPRRRLIAAGFFHLRKGTEQAEYVEILKIPAKGALTYFIGFRKQLREEGAF